MRTVRTTMRPHEPLTVSEQEYTDLRRRGVLVPEPAAPPAVSAPPEVDEPVDAPLDVPAVRAKGGGGGR